MVKKIYGNFNQQGVEAPTLVKAFGDEHISLGFNQGESLPERPALGVYIITTGDELGDGSNSGKVILCSFSCTSPVKSYVADVIDTMKIKLVTFDVFGNPVDVHGDFSIELSLHVEG